MKLIRIKYNEYFSKWNILMKLCLIFITMDMLHGTKASGSPAGNIRQHEDLACDGDSMHLRCPGSDIIHVKEAFYGRQDDMKCVTDQENMEDLDCSLPNIAMQVSKKCNGKTLCDFLVSSTTFTDPCPGTRKYLQVKFECVPLIISCPGKLKSAIRTVEKQTTQKPNGAWVRDPYQETDRIYYMGYESFTHESRQIWEFGSLEDMAKNNPPVTFYQMNDRVDGTGFVVYDRNMYFNVEGTKKVSRFDLSTQSVEATVTLDDANYHNTSPYSIDLATDIDLAVDENGLWVIYATEKNLGNIVISRLEHVTLKVIQSWQTKYDKISALNTFIICGVLYAVNANTLKIDYMFNTTANEGSSISIALPGITATTSAIEYNPRDRKLYVWDEGRAINYKLMFEAVIIVPPSPTTVPTTTITTTTKRPVRPKPTQPRPTPSKPNVIGATCKGSTLDGYYWEDTPYGETAKQNCPGSTVAQAIWVCGGNNTVPQWVTKVPDFTYCISDWIRNIQQRMLAGEVNAAELSTDFRNQLQATLEEKEPELTSWDIVASSTLLQEFLNRSTNNELQYAVTLADNTHECTSLLLRSSINALWRELDNNLQNKVAGELISTLEGSAFFLSYDMSLDQGTGDKSLNLPTEQVTLGIRVEPIKQESDVDKKYESIRWWSGQGDSVKVHTSAVVESLSNDPTDSMKPMARISNNSTRYLSIILMSFRNIGNYMKDPVLYSTHENPVNSRIVSISAAASTLSRDDFLHKQPSIKLTKPITLTMKHITPRLIHNVCAYWKFIASSGIGQWSRRGCRRVSGNDTHSTCECMHMTSFAVLSSNQEFPLMEADESEPPTVVPVQSTLLNDLPIVRTGLGVSIFCLLIVAITLIAVRSIQSDTNTIHKNFVLSLLFTEIVFIAGIDYMEIPELCGTIAALLHYGILAAFTWATLEAFHLMVTINDVNERTGRWRWYYVVGYSLPAIVVATSAAVDHEGYGSTFDVCWLNTDGAFIWSFIGPCCFIIVCCVVFLAITMYKLHLHAVNFSVEAPKNKNIRAGVARSCVLMFLLCASWSCGVLWLSNFQPRATGILFCILLAAHGMATLVLYCILSSEIRRKYKRCFHCQKKSHEPSRHSSRTPMIVAHELRHTSSASMQPANTLRQNDTMQYPGYRYTLGSTGVCPEYRTTLVPESYARNMSLSKAADAMTPRAVSEMELTRITNVSSEPRYSVRGHSDGSAMDLTDDTNPNTPLNRHCTTDPRTMAVNGQYIPPNSGIAYTAHHYEQPLPHFSTVSSAASGAYNHLHEDYPSGSHHHAHDHCTHQVPQMVRRGNHYETLTAQCQDCSSNPSVSDAESNRPQAVHYKHRYEDVQPLTVCVAQARSDVQCASYPCFDGGSPQYRVASSSNGDLVNGEIRIMGGSNCTKGRGCRTMPGSKTLVNQNQYNAGQKQIPPTQSFTAQNHYNANGMPPRHHSNIVMGTTVLSSGSPAQQHSNIIGQPAVRRQRNGSYSMSKTGRASDPLSTDQGYDTDSQMLQCKTCGGTHSEENQCCNNVVPPIKQPLIVRAVKPSEGILHPGSSGKRLLPPSPATTSSTSSITQSQPERNTKPHRLAHKRGSTSDLSDCTSENDREVEMIYTSVNGSSTSSPAAHGDSGAFDEEEDEEYTQAPNSLNIVDPPAAFSQQPAHNEDLPEDLIDVERGGRMSVAESVTSWCGQSGSHPLNGNPSYGRQKSSKKSTNDPQVILANARKSRSNNNHNSKSQSTNNHNNEHNTNRHNSTHNGYTLRGSTEAGTKARVDLKAGSISMVTNL